ncbi:CoA transferase [Bordetella sp. BOR01]|uniref:CaiB/BaiF CoA transferase family protein n=1 Tax=Bordetella sp. BOR01 TaxID=2854779 RepID=UPI001C49263A|nr:CoA transferase [Bordetella sp. BOR01]
MKPLEGIRILDLSRVVSGPFCTMLLGDLGAEVIKIEEPRAGDDSRAFGPPFVGGESAYFLSVNRNKQSCCIDLKSEEGRALIVQMAEQADVLVENFRPGTLERLGLGRAMLRAANPRLILCSITGFGRTGPDADRPGYDLVIQGECGFMDITGFPDGPPTKAGTSIADLVTGLYASQGILAAVIERQRSGMGGTVDLSMLDCMASLLTFNAGIYFATGSSPERRGNVHPTIAPYETFRAADGWLNVGVANDKFWKLFCDAVDLPGLAQDARFRAAPDRVAHRAALVPEIEARLRGEPRAHWLERLVRAGVPCGAIRSVGEVCEAAQLTQRGMVVTLPHASAGPVQNILSPFRFDDRPLACHSAPPRHGEHTGQALSQWCGLDAAAVAGLAERRVVRILDGDAAP